MWIIRAIIRVNGATTAINTVTGDTVIATLDRINKSVGVTIDNLTEQEQLNCTVELIIEKQ